MRFLAFLVLLAAPANAATYGDYANQCRAEIGDIPAFSCAAGVAVPITVNGETPNEYTKDMTCDRPALLPNGSDSDGQCVPGSRILNLSDDSKQISVMCRQKHIRLENPLRFDEIDIIAHNPVSGATCWFQASAVSGQSIDGTTVPSATDPASHKFFNHPETVVEDGCGTCHDNDPFMYSPFVGQVWGHVPTNPFGPYYHVNLPDLGFDMWPLTQILPRDSTCTSCHRIGVHETCGQLTDWASGQLIAPGSNPLAASYPLSHWMPPYHNQTERSWDVINGPSVDTIGSCCLDPTQPMCNATEILKYLE